MIDKSSASRSSRDEGRSEARSRQENPECEEEHVEQNSETQYRDPVGKQPHPAKASHRPEANIA